MDETPVIEDMSPDDLEDVMSIEHEVFGSPWTRGTFASELDHKDFSRAVVVTCGGQLVGYCVAWFIAEELHIGNVAVRPAFQRRGLGTLLVEDMIREALTRKCEFATLEVRASNTAAISMYKRLGFKPIAMRRGYYAEDQEDAVVMLTRLTPHSGQEDLGSDQEGV